MDDAGGRCGVPFPAVREMRGDARKYHPGGGQVKRQKLFCDEPDAFGRSVCPRSLFIGDFGQTDGGKISREVHGLHGFITP